MMNIKIVMLFFMVYRRHIKVPSVSIQANFFEDCAYAGYRLNKTGFYALVYKAKSSFKTKVIRSQ